MLLTQARKKFKQFAGTRAFEQALRAGHAQRRLQLDDAVNVLWHHRQLEHADAVPRCCAANACFASINQLQRVEHLEAVLGAPLEVVHVLKHRMAYTRQTVRHGHRLQRREKSPR